MVPVFPSPSHDQQPEYRLYCIRLPQDLMRYRIQTEAYKILKRDFADDQSMRQSGLRGSTALLVRWALISVRGAVSRCRPQFPALDTKVAPPGSPLLVMWSLLPYPLFVLRSAARSKARPTGSPCHDQSCGRATVGRPVDPYNRTSFLLSEIRALPCRLRGLAAKGNKLHGWEFGKAAIREAAGVGKQHGEVTSACLPSPSRWGKSSNT